MQGFLRTAPVVPRLERGFASVFGAMEEGVVVTDPTGRVVFSNQSAARWMGVASPEAALDPELSGRVRLLDPSGRPFPPERLPDRLALAGEAPPPVEVIWRLLCTGEEWWLTVTATPLLDEEGRIEQVVTVYRDITAPRRSARAMRLLAEASAVLSSSVACDAPLQALAELTVPTLADGCSVDMLDADGVCRQKAWAHRDSSKVGLIRELRSRNPLRLGKPRLVPLITEELLRAVTPDPEDLRLLLTLGLQSSLVVPLCARGRILGLLTLYSSRGGRRFDEEDLSLAMELGHRAALAVDNARLYEEAQAAREQIRASEERQRLAMAAGRMGYFDMDFATRSVLLSPRFEDLLGVPPGTFGGTYEAIERCLHPVDFEESRLRIRRMRDEGRESEHYVYRAIHPDGSVYWIESYAKLVRDEAGRPARVLGIGMDVTERYEAQEKVRGLVTELRRSNSELEQFAYLVSHDLQEPLRTVGSYTRLLARRYQGRLDSDADEFIQYALDGVSRMKRLIDDLLGYSRVGTQATPPVPACFKDVLGRALDNLGEAVAESQAEVSVDGAFPVVMADEVQLEQLLQNLLGNALKFRGERPPRVRVGAEERGAEWVFYIRDNGIGIAPEFFERIFIIFQRLHEREAFPGTGIGLAICKRIVERHGGRIWVESTPGEGTTFFFTLPVLAQARS